MTAAQCKLLSSAVFAAVSCRYPLLATVIVTFLEVESLLDSDTYRIN